MALAHGQRCLRTIGSQTQGIETEDRHAGSRANPLLPIFVRSSYPFCGEAAFSCSSFKRICFISPA